MIDIRQPFLAASASVAVGPRSVRHRRTSARVPTSVIYCAPPALTPYSNASFVLLGAAAAAADSKNKGGYLVR